MVQNDIYYARDLFKWNLA